MRRVMAALAAVVLLAGCGGGDDEDQAADDAAAGTPTPAAAATACEAVPAELKTTISSTLDSVKLTGAKAVRSGDHSKAWYVAVSLNGPDGKPADPAVFATNKLEGGGLLYAVGGMAHEFSDMGHGEDTDAAFSVSSEDAKAALKCLG